MFSMIMMLIGLALVLTGSPWWALLFFFLAISVNLTFILAGLVGFIFIVLALQV